MKLKNETYDLLKSLVTIILPALATFLGIVLPEVGVPTDTTKMILTIISAVIAFIGTLIGISTNSYKIEKLENEHN